MIRDFKALLKFIFFYVPLAVMLFCAVGAPEAIDRMILKSRTISVRIDLKNKGHRQMAIDALKEWDEVSVINFVVVEKGGALVISDKKLEDHVLGRFIGHARRKGKIHLTTSDTMSPVLRKCVLLHEVGHFLGLLHVPGTVMRAATGENTARAHGKKLTKRDIKLIKEHENE